MGRVHHVVGGSSNEGIVLGLPEPKGSAVDAGVRDQLLFQGLVLAEIEMCIRDRGINMKNIGLLLNAKNVYFVPFGQDDPEKKPNSMIAHTELLIPSLEAALEGRQYQPVIQSKIPPQAGRE